MLRQIRNYRFNPFTEATAFSVITDEVHCVPSSGTYWVRLFELPDEDYSDPTSGTPVYMRNAAGTVFTEVSSSPGLNEFRVDYNYKTGWVELNSGNAGQIILACYRGTGSAVEAELVNALQWFQPATPFFGGDGSAGSVTISTNTALSEDPAGSLIALKQYANLTINASITLSLGSGVQGMVLAVQGKLKLNASAKIDVKGKGGAGGAANTWNDGSRGRPGGYGAGAGGGISTDGTVRGGGGGPTNGSGLSGVGIPKLTGPAGASAVFAGADLRWRSLANCLVPGAGGGAGASGDGTTAGAGGAGGGFIVINCGVLEVSSGVQFDASGNNGTAGGGTAGGGGGGAGGTIVILANRIIGETPANIESTMCLVTKGSAGGNGGAGADGYKRVVELYSYNVY